MVDLSIKNVPEEVAEYLRQRAEANNRSLQGELLTILEQAFQSRPLSLDEVQKRLKDLHLETGDDSTSWVREERDAR